MSILTKENDIKEEGDVAHKLGQVWGVTFHKYGFFDTIDWWIEKQDRYMGIAELKRRYCRSDTYPTIYLAQRKYIAMQLAKMRGGTAYFIVKFDDGIWYIEVDSIPPENMWDIRGRRDRKGIPNDMEPVIEVPMLFMTKVEGI